MAQSRGMGICVWWWQETQSGTCVPAGMAGRSQDRSLREELTCAICCELFSEPVMLDCMHHFCKGCIQAYWESCPHVPSCPQCRHKIPSRTFRTHYLLSGLVEKVRRCGSEEHQQKMQVSGFCQAGKKGTGAT